MHGLLVHSHGWIGALIGLFLFIWQFLQFFTVLSMSLSMFGHQTKLLLNAFIGDTPGWQSCNWLKTFSLNFKGITTLEPHNKQPNFTPNSFFLQTKSLNSSLFSHNPQFPVKTLSKTRAIIFSLLLSISTSLECSGELSNCNRFIPKQFLSSLVLFVPGNG